jgi:hypothetical protein
MRQIDPMPQRRLLELLRVDIDRAMEGDTRARNRLVRLTWDNPRSIHSTHVAYNLGREKYRWLVREVLPAAHASRDAFPMRGSTEARSLGRNSRREIESWLTD